MCRAERPATRLQDSAVGSLSRKLALDFVRHHLFDLGPHGLLGLIVGLLLRRGCILSDALVIGRLERCRKQEVREPEQRAAIDGVGREIRPVVSVPRR